MYPPGKYHIPTQCIFEDDVSFTQSRIYVNSLEGIRFVWTHEDNVQTYSSFCLIIVSLDATVRVCYTSLILKALLKLSAWINPMRSCFFEEGHDLGKPNSHSFFLLNVVWDMKYLRCIYSELDGFSPSACFFLRVTRWYQQTSCNPHVWNRRWIFPLALAEKTGGWWAVALAIREEEICDSDLAEEPGHVD